MVNDTAIDVRAISAPMLLGEGPVWDIAEQRLYWIDSPGRAIWRSTAEGAEFQRWAAPADIGAIALREQGGAVVTLANGVHFLDFKTGQFELLADPESHLSGTRMNDGKIDRDGRFVFGSFDKGIFAADPPRPPLGSLYRLDPDLSIHRLLTEVGCANGPCWSPDGKIFYFSDTWRRNTIACDWDRTLGTPGERRILQQLPADLLPDGATVDAEGCIWSVLCGVGEIRRITPAGEIDRIIPMPVLRPTSVMFGGPNLDILFVTSMSMHCPPARQAGMTFAIHDLGVHGLAERRFAG